jgi:ferrous iron transport protein A
MIHQTTTLKNLLEGKKGKIIAVDGGHGFQRKLRAMGIREGQTVTIVSRQPFRGPITIMVGSCQMTLGRGMTQKIIVEVL